MLKYLIILYFVGDAHAKNLCNCYIEKKYFYKETKSNNTEKRLK